jgi:hypothetical protein
LRSGGLPHGYPAPLFDRGGSSLKSLWGKSEDY